MFHLHKTSQVVTVSVDMGTSDYEKRLNQEGFTGGYRPLSENEVSLDECLSFRIPNMYFLKYGGIEELCVGGGATLSKGEHFILKTAPRSATGCDFKRVLIGSKGVVGRFDQVVLRIFPFPESEVWGIASFKEDQKAPLFLKRALGQFIRPLFAWIFEKEPGQDLPFMAWIPEEELDQTILVLKLVGLKPIIEAEIRSLMQMMHHRKSQLRWFFGSQEIKALDQSILIHAAYHDLSQSLGPLFGKASAANAIKAEKEFEKYFTALSLS